DAFNNGEAETDAARHPRTMVKAVKFLEYGTPFGMRNADTGVVDLDPQPRSAAAAADQHTAGWRIFDRIGNQVLQKPPQKAAIRADSLRARGESQGEAFLARQRSEFDFQPV